MKIIIDGLEYDVTPLIEWDEMFICVHNQYDSYKHVCTQEQLDTDLTRCISECLCSNGVKRLFKVVLNNRTLH